MMHSASRGTRSVPEPRSWPSPSTPCERVRRDLWTPGRIGANGGVRRHHRDRLFGADV